MKQTSKDKLIQQSFGKKTDEARRYKNEGKFSEAIEWYHKALFLREDPGLLAELAEIYETSLDISSAITFYRRAHQLSSTSVWQEKVRDLSKILGLQLLQVGSVKNILVETKYELFIKRYPAFQRKILKKARENHLFGAHLQSCLAYLQVNQRGLAMNQLQMCLTENRRDVDLLVLRALLSWSMQQDAKGCLLMWEAYKIAKGHSEVGLFVQMISPQLEQLYKQCKYDLIEKQLDKCRLKVKRALEMHPYDTKFLVLSAYLHRLKQNYEQALADLELANKTFEDKGLEAELLVQIALTYNDMGTYLFKQGKFKEAITLFSEGLTFKSDDWGILTNRGDCHRALNDYVLALEDYLHAYSLQKKNEDLCFRIACIYNMRGVALFNSKNFQLSLKQFQDSLRFSPLRAQFHFSHAKCLLQLGRKQEAVCSLERTITLDDKLIEAGQLLHQIKDPEEAKMKSRKVIVLSKQK